jgi:PHO85 cyclin-5
MMISLLENMCVPSELGTTDQSPYGSPLSPAPSVSSSSPASDSSDSTHSPPSINSQYSTHVNISKSNITPNQKSLPSLKAFIGHVLKRSQTSFLTLQLALLYLVRLRNKLIPLSLPSSAALELSLEEYIRNNSVDKALPVFDIPSSTNVAKPLLQMDVYTAFTLSIVLASKFLHDQTYTMKVWSTVTTIPTSTLVSAECSMLACLNYDLYVSLDVFIEWSKILMFSK